jgi:hypothetical protein
MRVMKTILMVAGAIFLILIGLFVWLGRSAAHFRTEQEPFARTFVADLSRRWDVADVDSRSGTAFIEQSRAPEGQQWLKRVSQLGRLKAIRDVQFGNYFAGPSGQTGVFTFKAAFENGEATLKVTVGRDGTSSQVLGLFVSDARLFEHKQTTQSRLGSDPARTALVRRRDWVCRGCA